MRVLVPTEEILIKANDIIEHIMIEKNNLLKQTAYLTQQRVLLLPRLMSDKLEVMVR